MRHVLRIEEKTRNECLSPWLCGATLRGAARIFERYQDLMLQYHSMVTMVKLLFILLFLSHWMACLYGSVYNFEREDPSGLESLHWEMYVAALFWAVQTLTTVGYGNVVPQTVSERMIAIMVMLLGGFMFSWIISAVSSAMTSDSAEMQAVEKLRSVRSLINDKQLPKPLVLRIKSYYRNLNSKNRATSRDIILELPDRIRADVNFFAYGKCIVDSISGDVLPAEIIVEKVCRSMTTETFTRDMPLAMPNEFVDRIAILMEGQVCVANSVHSLLIDDGHPSTRKAHELISKKPDDPTMGRLCGPGLLVNPGVALGFQRGTLAVVPYDKQVEALVFYAEDLKELINDNQPDLMRNIMDTFLSQLSISKKALQRMGLTAVKRTDLFDPVKEQIIPSWAAVLRSERAKVDEERDRIANEALAVSKSYDRELDKDSGAGAVELEELDPGMSAAKLFKAANGEQMEALQKQVQEMHVDLADVVGDRPLFFNPRHSTVDPRLSTLVHFLK